MAAYQSITAITSSLEPIVVSLKSCFLKNPFCIHLRDAFLRKTHR
jgi:hypothetical protein